MGDSKQMQQLSALLTVDAIEPCLDFWTGALGFEILASVPRGDALGFALLKRDDVQVMYQTRDSVRDDLGPLTDDDLRGRALFYVKVADIDDVERRLEGGEIVVPRRETFYGATEIAAREPGGNLVIFAQFAEG